MSEKQKYLKMEEGKESKKNKYMYIYLPSVWHIYKIGKQERNITNMSNLHYNKYKWKRIYSDRYCDWDGRKDKVKDHCRKQHFDKTFKLRIAENKVEKFFSIAKLDEVSTVVSPLLSS